jgi:hypothetical protein
MLMLASSESLPSSELSMHEMLISAFLSRFYAGTNNYASL